MAPFRAVSGRFAPMWLPRCQPVLPSRPWWLSMPPGEPRGKENGAEEDGAEVPVVLGERVVGHFPGCREVRIATTRSSTVIRHATGVWLPFGAHGKALAWSRKGTRSSHFSSPRRQGRQRPSWQPIMRNVPCRPRCEHAPDSKRTSHAARRRVKQENLFDPWPLDVRLSL